MCETISISVEALEEAELRLQREESVDGWGCSSSDDDDDEEEDVLMVDGGVAAVLQEVLFRRQCLTDRCSSPLY